MESRPYGFDTVFGYIVMLDPSGLLKKTLYPSDETDKMDLNSGESIILNYLLNGQFYCHTGWVFLFIMGSNAVEVYTQAICFLLFFSTNHDLNRFVESTKTQVSFKKSNKENLEKFRGQNITIK